MESLQTTTPVKMTRRRAGFTIVELLIVVIVIAILATIAVMAYTGVQQKARDSAYLSEISSIQKSIHTRALLQDGVTLNVAAPIGYSETIGSVNLVKPLENAQNISMYVVFSTSNEPSGAHWYAFTSLQPESTTNSLRFRTGSNSVASARVYYATSAQQNQDIVYNGIFNTAARHIGWMTTAPNTILSGYNTSAANRSITTHDGWSFDSLMLSKTTGVTPLAAFVFPESHDATARAQIVAWLNEKYQVGL